MFKLQVRQGNIDAQEIELIEGREYRIGRSSECDFVLPEDPGLSRQHVRIFEADGKWQIEVLSRYGMVRADGKEIKTLTLGHGKIFSIQNFEFRCVDSSATRGSFAPDLAPRDNSKGTRTGMSVKTKTASATRTLMNQSFDLSSPANSLDPGPEAPPDAPSQSEVSKVKGGNGESVYSKSSPDLSDPDNFQANEQVENSADNLSGEGIGPSEEIAAEGTGGSRDLNDATVVGRQTGVAKLKVNYESGRTVRFVLDDSSGSVWIVGRDSDCAVVLEDQSVALRQFQIERSGSFQYTLKPIGRTNFNPLQINGADVEVGQPTPLKSGDFISVGGLRIWFEIHDSKFKEKLSVVPKNVLKAPPLTVQYSTTPAAQGSNSLALGGGGVIALNQNPPPFAPQPEPPKNANKKPLLFILAIGILGLLAYIFLDLGAKPPSPPKPIAQLTPFERLTPQNQEIVRNAYNLAKQLHLQQKYKLAQAQLEKIFELLPNDGYNDARELLAQCKEAYANEERLARLRKEEEDQLKLRQKVTAILNHCNQISFKTESVEEIKSCLTEAVTLDPENGDIKTQIDRVSKRAEEAKLRLEKQADYRARVQRTREAYKKAEDIHKKGALLPAIEAYNKVLATTGPDPDNLKEKATQNLAQIKQSIQATSEDMLRQAQQLYEQANYRDAMGKITRGRRNDPNNQQLNDLGTKIQKDLTAQLQELYSNSVLDEGLGKIEEAKEKWKKITEIDTLDGDYYRRAKNKLRTYGAP